MGNNFEADDVLARQLMAGKEYTYEFDVEYTNPQGKTFRGTFSVHRPTIGEKIKIGVLDSKIRGGAEVDVYTQNLSYMLATLMVVVDESPKWFQPGKVYEFDLLAAVFKPYIEWENNFFRDNSEQAPGSEESSNAKSNMDVNAVDGGRKGRIGPADDKASN